MSIGGRLSELTGIGIVAKGVETDGTTVTEGSAESVGSSGADLWAGYMPAHAQGQRGEQYAEVCVGVTWARSVRCRAISDVMEGR